MSKIKSYRREHPVLAGLVGMSMVLTVFLVGAAVWLYQEVSVPYVEVKYVVPQAPQLTAEPGETLYRIDASQSSVSYAVEEQVAGTSRTAEGSTSGIAGDVVVDPSEPTSLEVGQVVIDVAQLTSDQELRDQRLQHDFLQSQDNPLVTFDATDVQGFDAAVGPGDEVPVTITGDLTVKRVAHPVTLEGVASIDGESLVLDASAAVSLADLGIGPIALAGFVSASDDARLDFDIVAVDASTLDVPESIAAPERLATAVGAGPSFSGEVQPLLEQHCASCHQDEGVGSDVWALDTAGDASEVAEGLGLVVQSRYMPPWPASDVGIPLEHDRSLSDDDLATLVSWAQAGGPLDVDASTAVVADEGTEPELERDLVLTMPEAYAGSTDTPNDYRCFTLDPELTETTYLRGLMFEPDQEEVTHHALTFLVDGRSADDLERLDDADPGVGWECYSGPGNRGRSDQIGAWAPGGQPAVYPEGVGMKMEPGDKIVVQVHYHYIHEAPADASSLVLDLVEDPTDVREVRFDVLLAPAEIPCGPDESGPLCDREASLARAVESFGRIAEITANGLHFMCGSSPGDAVLDERGRSHASCDHPINWEGEVLSVWGHMHEYGESFRMYLNKGTPEEKILLDLPAWDFAWQMGYDPVEDIFVGPGDTISIECTWDRALVPDARHVIWAEGTEDEMCYSTVVSAEPRR
jgi:polyisoprenoid-binding protein YceI/mono/diheme cytochrome c family protein